MSPADLEQRFATVSAYPIETWQPSKCGDMDIIIRNDGTWWHEGSPIQRQSLIALFAKLLRKEPDGYYLVTPVEKLKITVEDLPFLAVDFERSQDNITFITNLGDQVSLGPEHPLAFDGDDLRPRIRIRHDLWARVARSAWYRLVDIAEITTDQIIVGAQSFDLKPSVI